MTVEKRFGHNSGPEVRGYVDRVVRLMEERKGITDDISEIMKEAQGNGYDTKALRETIRLARMDKSARDEAEALRQQYASAYGDLL